MTEPTLATTSAPAPTVTQPAKSVVAAFFLALLLGPLGLLYASITGGIVLLLLAVFAVPLTGGLAAFLIWPASIVWAVIAALATKSGKAAA